jgi:hypothetical protein
VVRRNALMVAAAVSTLLLSASCGSSEGEPRATANAAGSSTPEPNKPGPSPLKPKPGTRLALPTHCGVLSATVKGELWLAAPPLGDDSHNPPPGWGENETLGHFKQTGPSRGVFVSDDGLRATFRKAQQGATDPSAGCE